MGLALGRAVLAHGATAVLSTRNIAKAQSSAPDIEKDGGNWLELDHSEPNAERILEGAVLKYDIDVLVNNAAFATIGAIEDCRYVARETSFRFMLGGPSWRGGQED